MAYQRTEYHREVQRDDDRDNKQGGWKSWFGLGGSDSKDHEDRDRGYNYSNTTTYRGQQPSSYGYSSSDRYPTERSSGYSGAVSGGYSGSRGGYGYTTSDEVNRGPSSWNTDRDYNTRSNYGTSGDRDVSYKQETRTYGGDRDNWTTSRPTDYSSNNTSRSYGFSGEQQRPSSRGYITSDSSSRYPSTQTGSDYNTRSNYGNSGDRDVYYKQETRTYGGDNQYTPSRNYGFSGENTSRQYGNTSTGLTGGFGGDRDTSRSYGYSGAGGYTSGASFGGDRDTRGSYQQTSSYRY